MCVDAQRGMANVGRVVWPPQGPQDGKINILNEKINFLLSTNFNLLRGTNNKFITTV